MGKNIVCVILTVHCIKRYIFPFLTDMKNNFSDKLFLSTITEQRFDSRPELGAEGRGRVCDQAGILISFLFFFSHY